MGPLDRCLGRVQVRAQLEARFPEHIIVVWKCLLKALLEPRHWFALSVYAVATAVGQVACGWFDIETVWLYLLVLRFWRAVRDEAKVLSWLVHLWCQFWHENVRLTFKQVCSVWLRGISHRFYLLWLRKSWWCEHPIVHLFRNTVLPTFRRLIMILFAQNMIHLLCLF